MRRTHTLHDTRNSRERARQLFGQEGRERLLVSGPVHYDATTAFPPDNCQRHTAWTGAPFGAPGHVHHWHASAGDRSIARKKWRKRAGRYLRRSTGRRASAGNNPASRIARTDDEAKLLRNVGETRSRMSGDADEQERMGRSGAQTRGTREGCRACKLLERGRIRMSEGETEADRHGAVAKRVLADRLGRRPLRQPRVIDMHGGDRVAKGRSAVSCDNIPRARCRSRRCDDADNVHCSIYRVLGGDGAQRSRATGITSESDVKVCWLCPHPHVGRNGVEVQRTATIESDGNLWGDPDREGRCCNRATKLRGHNGCVEYLIRIEAGQRIVQDRRSFAKCDLDRAEDGRQ